MRVRGCKLDEGAIGAFPQLAPALRALTLLCDRPVPQCGVAPLAVRLRKRGAVIAFLSNNGP